MAFLIIRFTSKIAKASQSITEHLWIPALRMANCLYVLPGSEASVPGRDGHPNALNRRPRPLLEPPCAGHGFTSLIYPMDSTEKTQSETQWKYVEVTLGLLTGGVSTKAVSALSSFKAGLHGEEEHI